jgi:hypothetical protein
MYAFLPDWCRDGISLAEEGCLAGVARVDRLLESQAEEMR